MTGVSERIAATLARHRLTDEPTWANEAVCTCGEHVRKFPPGVNLATPSWEAHVAAVLVETLQLHGEWSFRAVDDPWGYVHETYLSPDDAEEARMMHRYDTVGSGDTELVGRYVTAWEREQ